MIARSTIDRLTISALLLTVTLPFAALSPVQAATNQCAAQAQEVITAAAAAEPQAAAKALRTARLAEKICAEGNRHEAGKKFAQAREQLGTNIQFADRR